MTIEQAAKAIQQQVDLGLSVEDFIEVLCDYIDFDDEQEDCPECVFGAALEDARLSARAEGASRVYAAGYSAACGY